MLNLVLFGPPGAGKGTQSEKLIAKYQLKHLSTGDIFRANIKGETELGSLAKSYMNAGKLVPDEVTIRMLETEVNKYPDAKGFIFDGFPRTRAQAEALDELLHNKNTNITLMIALEVEEEELKKRLLIRGQDSGRIDDQDPDIVQKRIDVYNQETAPVKEFYASQGKFKGVNGIGDIEDIFNDICTVINMNRHSYDSSKRVAPTPAVNTSNETVGSKIAAFAETVKEAITDTIRKVVASRKDKPAVKKVQKPAGAPKKIIKTPAKAIVKKTAAPAKKTAPAAKKVVKKTPVKKAAVKKLAAKKTIVKKALAKKVSRPVAKKTVKKTAAKKTAPKKVLKKTVKKAVKKTAAKKIVRKPLKKVTRPAAKKTAPKKMSKPVAKTVKKANLKKAAPKKALKKQAPKKAVKKSVKKSTAKKAGKRR